MAVIAIRRRGGPMRKNPTERSLVRHLLGGVPRYFDSSPFDDRAPEARALRSPWLECYAEFVKSRFVALPETATEEELAWLEGYHRARLDAEREERRMHFGAFALVGILFFLLLPALIAQAFQLLAFDIVALLLLVLLVPYAFVYFGYENRVRAMTVGL